MAIKRRRERRGERQPGADDWLMTYADMITLLLCFFAVFLSVSQPQSDKLEQAEQEVKKVFSKTDKAPSPEDFVEGEFETREHLNMPSGSGILPTDNPNPFGIVSTNRNLHITPGDRITTIEMDSSAFFDIGSATLNPEGSKILDNLVDAIKDNKYKDYRIVIEGHTDDSPIKTPQFPSNWELSTARAASVVRLMIDKGIPPNRLRAAGYADTFPKVPNRDESGKPIPANQAQNRRVIIRLEKIEKNTPDPG